MSRPKCTPIVLTPQDIDRFWSKVDRSGGPDACWPWTAGRFTNGYGQFGIKCTPVKAHRVAWVIENEQDIPEGLIARHFRCRNKLCCNPAHICPGTHKDNADDREVDGMTARGDRNGQRVHPDRTARGKPHSDRMRAIMGHGERNPNAKMSDAKAEELRQLHAAGGWTFSALGRWAGISRTQARNIVTRKQRRDT